MKKTLVLQQGSEPYLVHSGVRGMKHGVRQYQNRDGTWTELGKARRRTGSGKDYLYKKNGITDASKPWPKARHLNDEKRKQLEGKALTTMYEKGIFYGPKSLSKPPRACMMFANAQKYSELNESPRETALRVTSVAMQHAVELSKMVVNTASDKKGKNEDGLWDVIEEYAREGYAYDYLSLGLRKYYCDFSDRPKPLSKNEADQMDYINRQVSFLKKQRDKVIELRKENPDQDLPSYFESFSNFKLDDY